MRSVYNLIWIEGLILFVAININSMNVGEKWSFQNSNCQSMFLVVDSVQFMDKILAHCL